MAKKHRPTSYELLGQRVKQIIAAATWREQRQVHLQPAEGDSPDDWDRLIDEISENENVDVTRTDEGWLVSWVPVGA
ncbi:DUF1654 domain-containing protein [Halomonas elongata]|uniref:DUF1654 domain-containing protein n=1 Tax=Halomonas elongata (strain ATCC 33173 / DSM 2581 / NBRC 15536 / NCIMB 2198 / 1H9) TaxID=768066 RepID=A0ABZ0T6J3_HALED|nr:DUF1654 domain-containing protein [Halomonas elongata]WBF17803.1 DUF1654 domain-containing protein [Halomonas elongata]WPU46648.1 DUF1654 domain-containing protein [Halomonas elongata DSM 2581]